MNHMLDAMNSGRNFTFTDTWGYLDNKTNTINGMLGALLYKTADIGSKFQSPLGPFIKCVTRYRNFLTFRTFSTILLLGACRSVNLDFPAPWEKWPSLRDILYDRSLIGC